MDVYDYSNAGHLKRLERVKLFLAQPNFNGFTRKDLLLPAWHSIAALSNMAEAITNLYVLGKIDKEEAQALLEAVVFRAKHRSVNPYRRDIEKVKNLSKWGYYLEHLNICLGSLARVALDNPHQQLNRRVSEHLRENTLRYPHFHADLHVRSRMKWPADQAAILYSLWLYDQNYQQDLSSEPIEGWYEYMDRSGTNQETGLYVTEVNGVKKFSPIPRGCAHSYLCHYVGRFNQDKAITIWDKYKRHFLKKTIIGTGFREYPQDFKYRWTPDSGPIFFGLGAAATGIGINAASTVGDSKTYRLIEKSLDRVNSGFRGIEKVIGNNLITRVGTDYLATSIRLNAETKYAWY
jgi:hypothetical protein